LASIAKGEAKQEALMDARIAYLMGQLKERAPKAIRARQQCNEWKDKLMKEDSSSMEMEE